MKYAKQQQINTEKQPAAARKLEYFPRSASALLTAHSNAKRQILINWILENRKFDLVQWNSDCFEKLTRKFARNFWNLFIWTKQKEGKKELIAHKSGEVCVISFSFGLFFARIINIIVKKLWVVFLFPLERNC